MAITNINLGNKKVYDANLAYLVKKSLDSSASRDYSDREVINTLDLIETDILKGFNKLLDDSNSKKEVLLKFLNNRLGANPTKEIIVAAEKALSIQVLKEYKSLSDLAAYILIDSNVDELEGKVEITPYLSKSSELMKLFYSYNSLLNKSTTTALGKVRIIKSNSADSSNPDLKTNKSDYTNEELIIKIKELELLVKMQQANVDVDAINNKISAITLELNALKGNIPEEIKNALSSNIIENFPELKTYIEDRLSSTGIQEAVNKAVNNIAGIVLYRTGEEIEEILETTAKADFPVVFCTATSQSGDFKLGKIYYYNRATESIDSMSGGGSSVVTTTIDAGLSISAVPANNEINSEDVDVAVTIKAVHPEILKDNSIILNDGTNDIVIENLKSGYSTTLTFSAKNTKSFILSLNAETIDNTETEIYTAASRTATVKFYIPILFGNYDGEDMSTLSRFTADSKTVSADITAGRPVYLYASASMYFKQLGAVATFDSIEDEALTINGVIVTYKKHTINVVNDTYIKLEIEKM